jgi:DNA-binding transcriptional MerR regulator
MSTPLTISVLADRVGLSADAVRYYERLGLLPTPKRSAVGYRLYDQEVVERLRFVKGAQRLGLRLREIRELLEVVDRGRCPCGHTQTLLAQRLAEVDAELVRLTALRAELARLLNQAPQDACAATTASQWWCVQEFSQAQGGDGDAVPELRLPVR